MTVAREVEWVVHPLQGGLEGLNPALSLSVDVPLGKTLNPHWVGG